MLNKKQYVTEFGASIILYTAAIFFSISFLNSNPDTSLRVWVSLLPVLPALLATIAVIRALRKLDELQQKIQLMSFASSFAIVGLSTFTYGFLENVGFPHIPYIWVFPFMIATWGLATPVVARIYK
jgi:ABC-type Na+ efflux pump permease subunit